jgi:hypothetical protein
MQKIIFNSTFFTNGSKSWEYLTKLNDLYFSEYDYVIVNFIRLQIILGCRVSEVFGAMGKFIDLNTPFEYPTCKTCATRIVSDSNQLLDISVIINIIKNNSSNYSDSFYDKDTKALNIQVNRFIINRGIILVPHFDNNSLSHGSRHCYAQSLQYMGYTIANISNNMQVSQQVLNSSYLSSNIIF